jgi:N-acetylneuraminic acid mutarotase
MHKWSSTIQIKDKKIRRNTIGISCSKHNNSLYVFRGDSNNFYEFNIITSIWKEVLPKNTGPSNRTGHTSVVCGNYLYIFGGLDNFAHGYILYI